MDGIPISIKDNFCSKDVRTTCASHMLADYIPPYDSTVVQKLVSGSGAVMMGKTNMDEFAMGSGTIDSHFGPSKNPWLSKLPFKVNSDAMISDQFTDDWHIAGGSSGGSVIAVATGASFAAIGSDTGGSTRHPAALVGVCGMKPSYGSISRHGLIPLAHSLDTPGIIARNIEDVRVVLEQIAGFDPKDSTSIETKLVDKGDKIDLRSIRIGIPDDYNIEGMSTEVKELWTATADKLSKLGAEVVSVSLPHTNYSLSCYSVLKACDVASNFSCYDGIEYGHRAKGLESSTEQLYSATRFEGFNEVVKGYILAGNYFMMRDNFEQYVAQAQKVRRLIVQDFDKVFNDQKVNILLTPVTFGDAPTFAKWTQKENRERLANEDFFTQPANMAGLPAVAVPCKLSKAGLPLALQLIGPYLQDHFVLSMAQVLEDISQFPTLQFVD